MNHQGKTFIKVYGLEALHRFLYRVYEECILLDQNCLIKMKPLTNFSYHLMSARQDNTSFKETENGIFLFL